MAYRAAAAYLLNNAQTRSASTVAAHPEFLGTTVVDAIALNVGGTDSGIYSRRDGRLAFTERPGVRMNSAIPGIGASCPDNLRYGAVSLEACSAITPGIPIASR